jgi:hypothetical protein
METGGLFYNVTISTCSEAVTNGDAVTSWTTPATLRASIEQVDGTRYLKVDELVDRSVYKLIFWDNSYTSNIRVVYNGLTLYPIRPLQYVKDPSNCTKVIALMATKV